MLLLYRVITQVKALLSDQRPQGLPTLNFEIKELAMPSLTFNGYKLNPVVHNNQIHLSSAELAKALGYANEKSISNLYNANADEFSVGMTEVITSMTPNNLKRTIRIFSLRGCHLIAMFTRTKVAKEFRKGKYQFRLAQEMITIGNVSFPKAYQGEMEYGRTYYVPSASNENLYSALEWEDDLTDCRYLSSGMLHLSKANAIAHAEALIRLSGGKI